LFSELAKKEVVSTATGQRLGDIGDLELDRRGAVLAVVVPGESRFFGLIKTGSDIRIRWDHITCIGEDVILVDTGGHEKPSCQ